LSHSPKFSSVAHTSAVAASQAQKFHHPGNEANEKKQGTKFERETFHCHPSLFLDGTQPHPM
jgi:hypothetical protein